MESNNLDINVIDLQSPDEIVCLKKMLSQFVYLVI